MMSALAWLLSWSKLKLDKNSSRTKGARGNADVAPGEA